ncbi:hypothetical protein FHR71_004476 [Methylobacterium sp. RAS18]|nr:hypothetical protein [Methylobacterium sp. RAS18]
MIKRPFLILTTLLSLSAPAFAQTKALPPGEIRANGDITFGSALKLGKREGNKTVITPDVLQILGSGSTGDVSSTSVTGGGKTRSLADFAASLADFVPNASFSNSETGTKAGPGLSAVNPSRPFIFSTRVTTPQADNNDGSILIGKEVNYNSPTGPSSYFGAGALNAYTIHRGDTKNNIAAIVGQTLTYNTTNGQPYGPASSVGVIGQDVCKTAGCISGWGLLGNHIDLSGQENPACCYYGAEIGNFSYGSDDNNARRVLLIATHNAKESENPSKPAEVGRGIQFAVGTATQFKMGIDMVPGGLFKESAIQLGADSQQDISWRNAVGNFDMAGASAGSRFLKASDDNQYFDNFDATSGNTKGFLFRGTFAGSARNYAVLNKDGLNVPVGKVTATGGVSAPSVVSPTAGAGVTTGMFVRTVEPTTATVPASTCADWYNSATAVLKRVCNVAGTLRSIQYQ